MRAIKYHTILRLFTISILVPQLGLAATPIDSAGTPEMQALPLASGEGVSRAELEAYASAHGRVTLSHFLEASRPGANSDERLKRLLVRAQTAWLTNSLEAAKSTFIELTGLALEADWRDAQRESIFYAHMRLAQLAQSPTERETWLQKAAYLFPDLKPDSRLFPPPLIAEQEKIFDRARTLARPIAPSRLFPRARYVLIDGRVFELKPDLRVALNEGVHRVTSISDSYPSLSEKLTLSEIENFQANQSPIASGTCSSPLLEHRPEGIENFSILFAHGCQTQVNAGGIVSTAANGKSVNLNLALANESENGLPLNGTAPPLSAQLADDSSQVSRDSKRNWWTIGAAIILAGIAATAIQQAQSNQGSTEPVHHYGF